MELLNIETFQIARRFSQAGQSYDEHAVIQKKIANQLMGLMNLYIQNKSFETIFEIGCGSGNLSKLLIEHHSFQNIILNDLYDAVKVHFDNQPIEEKNKIRWLIGDIEQLDFPSELDMVTSSSALQWMHDLDRIFVQSQQVLNERGYLCFSTYGKRNLKEIKLLTQQGLQYLHIDEIRTKLEKNGFQILHLSEKTETLEFKHPKHILQHLKSTGVTATASNFRWTKQSLETFYQGYRQFIQTDEHENLVYPLTYHPIFVIARKLA